MSSYAYATDYVDGYKAEDLELSIWDAIAAPSVSATNTGRVYYDGTADTLKLSLNGGAYSDLTTALSGLLLDASNDPLTGTLDAIDILPVLDNTYTLGSADYTWESIYIGNTAYINYFESNVVPYTNNFYDLGSSTKTWKNLHIGNTAYILYYGQDILPSSTNAYDLGSSTFKFADLFIDGIAYIDEIDTPSIKSSTGDISFNDDDITGTGTLNMGKVEVDTITIDGNTIVDSTGTLSLGTTKLSTSGTLASGSQTVTGAITASGTITGSKLVSTGSIVGSSATIGTSLILGAGSIEDTSGSLLLSNDVTIDGDLTIAGNITLTSTSLGNITPTTDLAYSIGGDNLRYSKVCTTEIHFDADTFLRFDGNYIYLYVNGVEKARWGETATINNVTYNGSNVIYNSQQIIF